MENGGLDFVHSGVQPECFVTVFLSCTIVCEHSHSQGKGFVGCGDGSCITQCAEVLSGVETECSHGSPGSCPSALECGSVGLGSIFKQGQMMVFRELCQTVDGCQTSVEMDGEQSACAGGEMRKDCFWSEHGVGVNICQNGVKPSSHHGLGGGYESHGRKNHFSLIVPSVFGLHGQERQREGVKAISCTDAVRGASEGGK